MVNKFQSFLLIDLCIFFRNKLVKLSEYVGSMYSDVPIYFVSNFEPIRLALRN